MFSRILTGTVLLIVLLGGASVPASAEAAPIADVKIKLEPYVTGLKLPTVITHAQDDRLFVVEKPGRIRIIRDGQVAAAPFLDISSLVRSAENERGLLGLAFHPDYRTNGFFFVYYTRQDGAIVIACYKATGDTADPNSAKILLIQPHPRGNHNGGQLAFGPDGYLYAGLGDGGSAGDPDRNGQNPQTLLATILRLDVNQGDPYGIPKDNPFVSGGGRPEVWAYGLRNPWRFSFDRETADLYIADVGQNAYEEVDFQAAKSTGGVNYGWNVMEAAHCYGGKSCDPSKYQAPVFEYPHSNGCSITGGYVYRGKQFSNLNGIYFTGDYCSGYVWALRHSQSGAWESALVLESGLSISTFGQDSAGELYVADYSSGAILRLVAAS